MFWSVGMYSNQTTDLLPAAHAWNAWTRRAESGLPEYPLVRAAHADWLPLSRHDGGDKGPAGGEARVGQACLLRPRT